MTTSTTVPGTAELLKYANLQMAAEAFIRDPETGFLNTSGTNLINVLKAGNGHASKFTTTQAEEFDAKWKVLDQRANTDTGFSGTLFQNRETDEIVLSFRSTEFIDDAARDNKATNELEIKNTGFAWGQIADMQAWYEELKADGGPLDGVEFSVTGYSLGGHLATAFNLINKEELGSNLKQVVTFNGAGVGKMRGAQGSLEDALQEFNDLRNDPQLVAARLTEQGLAAVYQEIHGHLLDGSWSIAQAKQYFNNNVMPLSSQGGASFAFGEQALMLSHALDEIAAIAAEAIRVTTLTAGGSGPDSGDHPADIDASDIEALDLDYRMRSFILAGTKIEIVTPVNQSFD